MNWIDRMKTVGEKILVFLQGLDPERLSQKIQKSLEKISKEAAMTPMTEEEEIRTEYFFNFIFAVSFFAFIYMMYRILF